LSGNAEESYDSKEEMAGNVVDKTSLGHDGCDGVCGLLADLWMTGLPDCVVVLAGGQAGFRREDGTLEEDGSYFARALAALEVA
jgi:hypothetical protein